MLIDLDDSMGALLPWDLKLKIGGREYATVPPTVGQVILLDKFLTLQMEELIELVVSLFAAGDRPDVPVGMMPAVVAAYSAYFKDHSAKNSGAITAQVAAVMEQVGRSAGASGSRRS